MGSSAGLDGGGRGWVEKPLPLSRIEARIILVAMTTMLSRLLRYKMFVAAGAQHRDARQLVCQITWTEPVIGGILTGHQRSISWPACGCASNGQYFGYQIHVTGGGGEKRKESTEVMPNCWSVGYMPNDGLVNLKHVACFTLHCELCVTTWKREREREIHPQQPSSSN